MYRTTPLKFADEALEHLAVAYLASIFCFTVIADIVLPLELQSHRDPRFKHFGPEFRRLDHQMGMM